ncbi:hypothetical protein H0H81_008554, partial [Sphagnurus paluster]
MKQQALQLVDRRWELEDIAEVLGVSTKCIGHWADNFDTHGHVDPPSVLRGRPHILNPLAIQDLHNLIQETPSLFLDKIGKWLALYHNLPISTAALHNNLRDQGLTYKLLRKAAAERDNALWSDWMYNVSTNFTAEQLVVLNESSKDGHTLVHHYGRVSSGHDPVARISLDRGI